MDCVVSSVSVGAGVAPLDERVDEACRFGVAEAMCDVFDGEIGRGEKLYSGGFAGLAK